MVLEKTLENPLDCKEIQPVHPKGHAQNIIYSPCTGVLNHSAAAKLLRSCPTVRPHRRQPTSLPHPWDSPGKNTGVGRHFLFQYMKVKSQSEVAQLCPALSSPMDSSLLGSSVHGIFQARLLEWGAIASRCKLKDGYK